MNIRRVTFETDMHHVQSLRNKLCSLDINKSMKAICFNSVGTSLGDNLINNKSIII